MGAYRSVKLSDASLALLDGQARLEFLRLNPCVPKPSRDVVVAAALRFYCSRPMTLLDDMLGRSK